MSTDMSYTTEEIAKLLKISKLTVYDLIKKGELTSYRVGKQMRVDASELEAYKQRARMVPAADSYVPLHPQASGSAGPTGSVVITGHDIGLDILAKYMEKKIPGIRPLRSFVGSLDSLISMYKGEADIVSTHLLDGDTGEYNIPYIRKILVGSSYIVVNLLIRNAGLYVQRGNPHGLTTWADLGRSGLRLVNREKGSGARVLLEEQLRIHGIKPGQLAGYGNEQTNHLGVAAQIASGEADVGVGIEKTASIVGQIEFIPLTQERYDLVMLKTPGNQLWIPSLLQILQSDSFKKELQAISGYDLSRTGEILFET
ncbi:helix-turn-helix domain-containing protein [Paenibacillus zeisoli]|uniref:Helix-turn-helix domain-containing protein n=1 Tax=Paenibacillus zeisoli TaxID=2496267 RepID=A0A433XHQ4_9BACL|nr:helix-turn-helix transcriptional regulator [Paenibacillus zeisoli]RUT33592.1 helix-turn-helix domain-containing protein [Paenibacillus zeisoli]